VHRIGGRPAVTKSLSAGNIFSMQVCERSASSDNQCPWLVEDSRALDDQVIRLNGIVGQGRRNAVIQGGQKAGCDNASVGK
jgi:hypothetical protein